MNIEQKMKNIIKLCTPCTTHTPIQEQKLIIKELKKLLNDIDDSFIDYNVSDDPQENYEILSYAQGRLTDSEKQLMIDVGKHLVTGYHPLTHERDIISARELVMVFSAMYPDHPYFEHARFDYVRVNRRFGALLGRADSPLIKKKGSFYVPVEYRCEGSNYRNQHRNHWIMRNHKKYESMGPSDFDREYEKQKKIADEKYKEMVKKANLAETPSFL